MKTKIKATAALVASVALVATTARVVDMQQHSQRLARRAATAVARVGTAIEDGKPLILKLAGGRNETVVFNLVPKAVAPQPGVKEFPCLWHASRKAIVAWVRLESGAQMPWGCQERDNAYWAGLETAVETELERYYGLAPSPEVTEHVTIARGKPHVEVKNGPIPFSVRVKANSEAVKANGTITSVLYTLAPNEVTAAAAVVGGSAVVLDELGGNQGLSLYAVPSGQVVIVPNDPVAFAKNLGKAALDPREGVKVAAMAAGSFVAAPGGIVVAALPEELRTLIPPALQNPGRTVTKVVSDPIRHLNPFNW